MFISALFIITHIPITKGWINFGVLTEWSIMKQPKLVNYCYMQQYLNLLFEFQREARHESTHTIGFHL